VVYIQCIYLVIISSSDAPIIGQQSVIGSISHFFSILVLVINLLIYFTDSDGIIFS